MPMILECDGCASRVDIEKAEKHGRLAQVFYCQACGTVWRAYEVAEQARRQTVVEEFEAWRTQARDELRTALKRLPDE